MLREILEVLVVPNSFRSIDFSRKGVYCLTYRVFNADPKNNVHAYPFHLKTTEPSNSFQSAVNTETGTYRTQSFFISFNSQRLQFLPGGCLFRIQGPWTGTELQLQINLMHIDTDSIENPLIKPCDFKQKATKRVKVQKHKDYYGDAIFGQFDYFCSVEMAVSYVRLDYRFRLCKYQLSDFAKKTEKEHIQQQQQKNKCVKMLPIDDLKHLLSKSVEGTPLQKLHNVLVEKQIVNYAKLLAKHKKYLEFLSEIQGVSFWRRHQMLPKELTNLAWTPSSLDPVEELKSNYGVYNDADLCVEILERSNLIGKNIRFVWMLNYQLESYLLKRKSGLMRKEYEIELFFQSRRKYFRQPNADRKFEIERFRTQRDYSRHQEGQYPLVFAPFFDFPPKKAAYTLIVMVHGFQGSDYDMDLVKNYLMAYNRNIYCYVCRTLQGSTMQSIQVLGEKFAKETLNIMGKMGSEFQNISFIGYSLGGVIIRAGLKHLQCIKDRMDVLLTLASPHLGVSQLDNILVRTGVWYMSKVDNYSSMQSLAHADNYLNQLSKDDSLRWIKKLILLGSKQDQFVPGYSAKVLKTGVPETDILYQNIVQRAQDIVRIQVWFDSTPKVIDKLIGRKAHIEFLQSKWFCESFFSVYSRLF